MLSHAGYTRFLSDWYALSIFRFAPSDLDVVTCRLYQIPLRLVCTEHLPIWAFRSFCGARARLTVTRWVVSFTQLDGCSDQVCTLWSTVMASQHAATRAWVRLATRGAESLKPLFRPKSATRASRYLAFIIS